MDEQLWYSLVDGTLSEGLSPARTSAKIFATDGTQATDEQAGSRCSDTVDVEEDWIHMHQGGMVRSSLPPLPPPSSASFVPKTSRKGEHEANVG